MSTTLTAADCGFILTVAARRFGGDGDADDGRIALSAAGEVAAEGGGPFARAAAAAVALGTTPAATSRHAALLAMCAQLRLDGHVLVAPQGAVAGMVDGLARGRVSRSELTRWLEDRAVRLD